MTIILLHFIRGSSIHMLYNRYLTNKSILTAFRDFIIIFGTPSFSTWLQDKSSLLTCSAVRTTLNDQVKCCGQVCLIWVECVEEIGCGRSAGYVGILGTDVPS